METKGKPNKDVNKALREAYPFGERKHHPYKIWLDEIKRQKGIKPKLNKSNPNQLKMF